MKSTDCVQIEWQINRAECITSALAQVIRKLRDHWCKHSYIADWTIATLY